MSRFINYANGRRKRPMEIVEWSDFEEVCKDYDSEILELKDEIKGLKKTMSTLVKLAVIQKDYNDAFVDFLEKQICRGFRSEETISLKLKAG